MSAIPQSAEPAWTIQRLLGWTTDFLATRGVAEARLATEVLLAHALQCRRIDLYTRSEIVPAADAVERFRALIRRAAAHEPIAYLVGEKEFFSLAFTVNRDVLIPRPESETLVEAVLDHLARAEKTAPKLLDIGTGSGCLIVALLVQRPQATAVASDVSAAALALAAGNAERHGVLPRLTLIEADRLALPPKALPAGGFDVLLSNPPYIAAGAVADLETGVRDFEPHAALTDGADGLSFYRDIGLRAADLLAPDGVVIVEVADDAAADAGRAVTEGDALHLRATLRDRVTARERVLVFAKKGTT